MRSERCGRPHLAKKLKNVVARIELVSSKAPGPLRGIGLSLAKSINHRMGSLISVETDSQLIALTFDDGPNPETTPGILDVLETYGSRATFFMLTERAEAAPEIVERIIAESHEVAFHGIDHRNLASLGSGDIRHSLGTGRRRLSAVSGTEATLFRPPYGGQNLRSYLAIRRLGMQPVMWSVDPHDWEEGDEVEIAGKAVSKATAGGIVLLHDGFEPLPGTDRPPPSIDRVRLVEMILQGLTKVGLKSETVSALSASGQPALEAWFEPGPDVVSSAD